MSTPTSAPVSAGVFLSDGEDTMNEEMFWAVLAALCAWSVLKLLAKGAWALVLVIADYF
jgi:hypothetical protein